MKEKGDNRSNPAQLVLWDSDWDDLTWEAKVDKVCLNNGFFGQFQNAMTIFFIIGQDKDWRKLCQKSKHLSLKIKRTKQILKSCD